jgi:hypothetical protein
MAQRFKIHVDGKWTGGSYGTKAEAEAVAKKLAGKVEVLPKGGLAPKPDQKK